MTRRRRPRWLILEPYYGGSHRHLVDLLVERIDLDWTVVTLPPRKWKWRMRGAAVQMTRNLSSEPVDGIFASSLLDVAALRGLLPPAWRRVPLVAYFHENQLTYPVQVADRRDHHYGWTNVQSALAADLVLWNSAYNRDAFLGTLEGFVARMPDARPQGLPEAIAERSRVLPVPLGLEPAQAAIQAARPRTGPCRIVWNHRWEHDKDPDLFFRALELLAAAGLSFEVAVLGQSFERRPAVFASARQRLRDRIVTWGFRESRAEYLDELGAADVVVSTARHEFQGLAVLEAALCGAIPLVPDDLAYPEIWPSDVRYPRGKLESALRDRILDLDGWRARDLTGPASRFGWSQLREAWEGVFSRPNFG